MANFDGHDDIIDSREIIERIEELETEATNDDGDIDADLLLPEDAEEYAALILLREDAESLADWHYGETLIHENYFTQAMKDHVLEAGYISTGILPDFIEHNINWDGVADDLRADYTDFEFRGVTYWARS